MMVCPSCRETSSLADFTEADYEEGHVARNWGQLLAHRPQETEAKRASLCVETNHSPMQLIFLGVLFV